ncbi:hypothetical protein QQ045_030553 [Rhodiola kirilowii]
MGSHIQSAPAGSDGSKLASKALRELEELYMGVPDESVNLTFQHLADVKQHHRQFIQPPPPSDDHDHNTKSSLLAPMDSSTNRDSVAAARASCNSDYNMMIYNGGQYHTSIISPGPTRNSTKLKQQDTTCSTPPGLASHNDDMTTRQQYGAASSKKQVMRSPAARGVGVERRGVPHTKICAICDTYIYVFRHRCLVCGRVYCRNCVNIGMGEMSEGRKCVECLGRRFSQRYIQRAGKMHGQWCCWQSSYSETVKQQELKWAENGPRISRMSNSGYNNNDTNDTSRTPNGLGDHNYNKSSSYHHENMSSPPSFFGRTTSPSSSSPPIYIFN